MLYSALKDVTSRYPDNKALIDDHSSLSYAQLWERVQQVASLLQAKGVQAGDRVALLADNSLDSVTLFWAVLRCRAINVYLNEQTPADGLQQILDDAQPVLIVATEKLAKSRLAELDAGEQQPQIVDLQGLVSDAAAQPPFSEANEVSADPVSSIATIVYTSGSTGKPKGVALTHANLIAVARMAGDGYNTVPSDSYLMVVPLHYIHGLMILVTMHLRGASIRFMNSFMFPRLVTKKLQDTQVTGFSGVPFHFTALIERGGFLEADLPHLRWVGVTGGTCSKERLAQIRQAQPNIEVHISYGQTECSPRITALHPDKIDTKADSVGAVADGLTVQFLDPDGQPVADGELGELVVSGPTVMHGYWNDPENTARVIDAQGRLHTGDLAYRDEQGDVFIKGRLQAMIKSAGERIFPEELEAILNACPQVVDVAVVGVPDTLYGQVVEAHVILNPDTEASLEAVKKYCLSQVAFARSPKNYHRWEAFPLKANGKTDRQKLMERSQAAGSGQLS